MDALNAAAVTVHIADLEIEGVAAAGRHEVARGLQLELTRLLADGSVPPRLLAGHDCQPQLLAAPGLAPLELGRAVARALYEAWL